MSFFSLFQRSKANQKETLSERSRLDSSLPPSPTLTKHHRRRRSSDSPVSPHSTSSHYSYHTLSPSLSPQPTPLKFHSPPLPPPVPPCSNSLENPSNSYSIEHFNQFYENSNGIRRTSRVNHGDLDWIRIELEGFQSGTTLESIESLLGRTLKFWRNLEEVEEGGRRFEFWVHGMNTARAVERQFEGWRLEEGREVRVWIVRGDEGVGDWVGGRVGEDNQFGSPPHPKARSTEYLAEDQERGSERMEESGRKLERSRSIRGRSDRSLSRDHKSHRREKDRDGGRRRSRKYQDEEEDRSERKSRKKDKQRDSRHSRSRSRSGRHHHRRHTHRSRRHYSRSRSRSRSPNRRSHKRSHHRRSQAYSSSDRSRSPKRHSRSHYRHRRSRSSSISRSRSPRRRESRYDQRNPSPSVELSKSSPSLISRIFPQPLPPPDPPRQPRNFQARNSHFSNSSSSFTPSTSYGPPLHYGQESNRGVYTNQK